GSAVPPDTWALPGQSHRRSVADEVRQIDGFTSGPKAQSHPYADAGSQRVPEDEIPEPLRGLRVRVVAVVEELAFGSQHSERHEGQVLVVVRRREEEIGAGPGVSDSQLGGRERRVGVEVEFLEGRRALLV